MTTVTLTITDFLLARIVDDETQARAHLASDDGGRWPPSWSKAVARRVLAECEAKRRIVEDLRRLEFDDPFRRGDYWSGQKDAARNAVVNLAAIWSDHPDYREEWKP